MLFMYIMYYIFSVFLVVSDSLQPHDFSTQGSSVHEIFQARMLQWVAISYSSGSFEPKNRT